MLRAVLDTNALLSDPLLRGRDWDTLHELITSGACAIHLPSVARMEAPGVYRRQLRSHGDKVSGELRKLTRYGMDTRVQKAVQAALTSLIESYEATLDRQLQRRGIEILNWPSTPHAEVVERGMRTALPFERRGGGQLVGYADTLIWLSVLELALAHPDDQVVLVSRDHVFAEEENWRILREETRKIFEGATDDDRVVRVPDLGGLVDVASQVGATEERRWLRLAAIREAIHGFDRDLLELTWWPTYNLKEGDIDSGDIDAGIPTIIDDVSIDSIEGPFDLAVSGDDDWDRPQRIRCEYEVVAHFDGFVAKADYWLHDDFVAATELAEVFVWDADWNDHVIAIDFAQRVHLTVGLVYDPAREDVTEVHLIDSRPA